MFGNSRQLKKAKIPIIKLQNLKKYSKNPWQIIEIGVKILDFVNKKVYNEYTNIDKVLYLNQVALTFEKFHK